MTSHIRITFGMIVLNGEPFVRYNLRSLYPWAHQIIVVEGACRTARAVATPDGHSTDGTLRSLQRFQAEEDPEKKVLVVHARDEGLEDGFWPEKTEMCQAFARRDGQLPLADRLRRILSGRRHGCRRQAPFPRSWMGSVSAA